MKSKMKLQKITTTSVIKRGSSILIRKEISFPLDSTLQPQNGKHNTVIWHHKTSKGVLNLYSNHDAMQLEEVYLKLIEDMK